MPETERSRMEAFVMSRPCSTTLPDFYFDKFFPTPAPSWTPVPTLPPSVKADATQIYPETWLPAPSRVDGGTLELPLVPIA
jgi:hypothetical protein